MRRYINLIESAQSADINEGRFSDYAAAGIMGLAALGAAKDWNPSNGPAPIEGSAKGSIEVPPPAGENDKDVLFMAATMWGEARSEGLKGMEAVGHVIKNRLEHKRDFGGDTVKDVVLKRKAFSCWNKNDPNYAKIKEVENMKAGSPSHRMFMQAQRIAEEILSGASTDPTKGSLFYHTDAFEPYWAKDAKPVAKVGSHLFYRVDGKSKS